MFINQGGPVINSSGVTWGVSSGHISSISLEVGLLTWADWQMAVGAVPVCFSVPPVDGICSCDGTAGNFHRVFMVTVGAAGCGGVAGATGAAGHPSWRSADLSPFPDMST